MSSECIGCGFCCWKSPCAYGALVYGPKAPCRALVWDGQRHWCQIALEDLELMVKHVAIGAGCCAGLNSWRYEPFQDRTAVSGG